MKSYRLPWIVRRLLQTGLCVGLLSFTVVGAAKVENAQETLPANSDQSADLLPGSALAYFPQDLPQSSVFASQPAAATSTPEMASQENQERLPLPWPAGDVQIPKELFSGRNKLDKAVLQANPRVYLHPEFDPTKEHTLIVGMPGWGGRSENFIWTMINGLKAHGLPTQLAVAAIQDTGNGGPRYQGQGDRAHANVWELTHQSVQVMNHFVARLSGTLRQPKVYLMGFSTGGVAAPVLATRLAELGNQDAYQVAGAVAYGTGSGVSSKLLKKHDLRVLFVTVPERRRGEPKPLRDDAWNRLSAEKSHQRVTEAGATAFLRHVTSASRHPDWHWGLISQCRYFPGKRIDDGRGYWPHYWMPNPEAMDAVSALVSGQAPTENAPADLPQQDCPC